MANFLPDSRLAQRPDLGCQMVDWPIGDGKSVRLEAQPIYCANCGTLFGWVPRDNTTFTFWLCNQCFEDYGAIVGTFAVPDEEFNRAVAHEVQTRYGRDLSEQELYQQIEQGNLGTALEKLAKESPYPVPNG